MPEIVQQTSDTEDGKGREDTSKSSTTNNSPLVSPRCLEGERSSNGLSSRRQSEVPLSVGRDGAAPQTVLALHLKTDDHHYMHGRRIVRVPCNHSSGQPARTSVPTAGSTEQCDGRMAQKSVHSPCSASIAGANSGVCVCVLIFVQYCSACTCIGVWSHLHVMASFSSLKVVAEYNTTLMATHQTVNLTSALRLSGSLKSQTSPSKGGTARDGSESSKFRGWGIKFQSSSRQSPPTSIAECSPDRGSPTAQHRTPGKKGGRSVFMLRKVGHVPDCSLFQISIPGSRTTFTKLVVNCKGNVKVINDAVSVPCVSVSVSTYFFPSQFPL